MPVKKILILMIAVLLSGFSLKACAEAVGDDIKLPAPIMAESMPLMDAMKNVKTAVKFTKESVPLELISGLLWAVNGVNADGTRNTPSSTNTAVLNVYVCLQEGIYKYDPQAHVLKPHSKEDLKKIVGSYPLVLVYTADLRRQSKYLASVDCGFAAQNAYLYSAANSINTAFIYNTNVTAVDNKMALSLGEETLFVQAFSYSPEK